MHFHVFIDKRKPQARTFTTSAAPGTTATREAFEHKLAFLRWHTCTVVDNGDQNVSHWLVIRLNYGNDDLWFPAAVCESIVNEVRHNAS
jgi:hypothetical protein